MLRLSRLPHAAQLDLFRPTRRKPDWQQLPLEVRARATRLLARSLRARQTQRAMNRTGRRQGDE